MTFSSKILSLLRAEKDRWILWLPVAIGAGVALYFALPYEPGLGLGRSLMAGMLSLAVLGVRKRQLWPLLIAGLAVAAGFNASIFRANAVKAPALAYEARNREVQGRIAEIETKEEGGRILLENVTVERLPAYHMPTTVRITLRKIDPSWQVGDQVKIKSTLFPPPLPALPGGYDFSRDYYFNGLGAVGYSTANEFEVTPGRRSAWHQHVRQLRQDLNTWLYGQLPGATGAVAAALITGDMTAIPARVQADMRASGLAHVLSISGLHLALAAGIVFFTVRLLLAMIPWLALRVDVKKCAAAAALVSSYAYLQLAGEPVPAQRSFIMVAFALTAILVNRQGISLYSLAWAAVAILLTQPESMPGASFQMSFAATLAIVAAYERFGYLLHARPGGHIAWRILLYPAGTMLSSLAATLATTPFSIYHFNQFTGWGLVANLLMIPLFSFIIMPAALLMLALLPLSGTLAALVAQVMGLGIDGMNAVAAMVASWPGAAMLVPALTQWGLALVAMGGLWLFLWHESWRWWGIPVAAAGMLSVLAHHSPDMFVSDDGRQVAIRLADGRLALLRGTAKAFSVTQWLRSDAKRDAVPRSDIDDPTVHCGESECIVERGGVRIGVALKDNEEQVKSLCHEALDVVIAGIRLGKDCAVAHVLDAYTLEKQGAYTMWFGKDGMRMVNVREVQGHRAWTND
jgi:competence protein ComEC